MSFEQVDILAAIQHAKAKQKEDDNSTDNGEVPAVIAAEKRRFRHFQRLMMHKLSLLHALCLQHLRLDSNLDNLNSQSVPRDLPPEVAAAAPSTKHHIPYIGSLGWWSDLFLLPSSCQRQAAAAAARPLAVIPGADHPSSEALSKRERNALKGQSVLPSYHAAADSCWGAADLRTAPKRDDANGIASTTTIAATLNEINASMSFEFSDLEGMRDDGGSYPSEAPLAIGSDRVYVAFFWVQSLLAQRSSVGGEDSWSAVGPPTSAAAWRALGEGYAAFEQCRALAETPFPFPWAQLMAVLLLIYSVSLPVLMVTWTDEIWLALVLNFFSGKQWM